MGGQEKASGVPDPGAPDASRATVSRTRLVAVLAGAVVALGLGFAAWKVVRPTAAVPQHAVQPAPAVPAHPFGFIDTPATAAVTGPIVRLTGWALSAKGIDRVEVRLDDARYAARYGISRPDVGAVHPALPGAARSGFEFDGEFGEALTGRHKLSVVAIDRDGVAHAVGHRIVIAPDAMTRWKPLLDAHPQTSEPPFYLLPATSGIKVRGADGIRETYASYESTTMRVGMRVPILYLRTTKGRAADWVFDPDWDFDRRCGERRIADDSLASVIAHSVANRLPVMFTLNGGIWADASCDVPDWDVNDELERDPQNCQWTARNTVPPDDALRNLPGSQASPEIGRGLTFNVYANKVRSYKRRNLQAAAAVIQKFAKQHPELFVGVSVDPDVYILPWYAGAEWFDFNPDTIRQFRHWLRGTGPYTGSEGADVPDLSAYRRAPPLTLAQVRRIAKRNFVTWDDVDPPRTFPTPGNLKEQKDWNAPWRLLWDQFRRHLVQVHYTELAGWAIDAGIAADKVYTAQAFTAPDPGVLPQAISIDSLGTDHDSAGVSVEGAIPRRGRLGVILYGESARNTTYTQTREPQFRILERMAGRWGVVEFSTANLKDLGYLPTYADAYRAFREITNFGGDLVSPMAWNGSNGIFVGQPGYVTYTSWRNTPAEEAAMDLLVERAHLPRGAKLWTFGTPRHEDSDGWMLEGGVALAAGKGYVKIPDAAKSPSLRSPAFQYLRGDHDVLVLGVADPSKIESVRVLGRIEDSGRWIPLTGRLPTATLTRTPAGLSIPLRWPDARAVVDQLQINITRADGAARLRIDHVALYPRG